MSDQFDIEAVEERGQATVMRLTGRLDAPAATLLRQRCGELREQQGCRHLALDLSGISFVASSGVGALLALTEEFGKTGGNLYLAPISTAVASVIKLLNLEQFLAIYGGVDEALAVLK